MRAVLVLIIIIGLGIGAYYVFRMRRAQLREQRHAVWRAKRAEEDRIWYEKMGDNSPGG